MARSQSTGAKEKNVAPFVTASSWAIWDGNTKKLIIGRKENLRREIASMTKMMTAYVVNRLVKAEIVSYADTVEITHPSAAMTGTTAKLQEKDELLLGELMYGLMLPSGNDAATAIAIYCSEALGGTG